MSRSEFSQWYADRKWRAIRKAQLQREPLCRFCQRVSRVTVASIADHIEPHRGDRQKFWTGELMSLCGTCHSSTKQRMEAGKRVGCDVNGLPLDSEHHWGKAG